MKNERILIVDDEIAIREMIRIALELSGFDCIEAEDALQAHHKIVDERPSLVLLDWMLPGMTGVELCRRLKRDETLNEIPVIMLTARSHDFLFVSIGFDGKTITRATYGLNKAIVTKRLQGFTQTTNMNINGSVFNINIAAPDLIEHLCP